jgi:CubicO group peptidase (beta-lactamase class C family)
MDAFSLFDAVDDEALERHGVSALAVGVLSGDERAERGHGVAPETTFRIASITKPIVAATAMRLVEEGRLALDEPVTGLRLPWDGITLRHLLSHQAGLAHDWSKPLSEYGEGDDALQRLAEDEAVGGPVGPGRLFAYSNPGYWLTGALIARAAEVPFEEAVHALVLRPLGMTRTSFSPVEPSVPSDLPFPRARRPSGGLYSSVGDLLRFSAHLAGGPGPLSPESLRAMQAPQIEVTPDADYGVGLALTRGRGRPAIEHAGGVQGIRSQLVVLPEDGTAFVLLTNSDLGHFLINRLLREVGLALSLPPEITVSGDDLAAVSGTFREPLGTIVRVAPHDGGVKVSLVGGDESALLRAVSSMRFVVREGDEKGNWAEFFERGRLMRYGNTLFERVEE